MNFGDEIADVNINIPFHAFDYLNLEQGIYNGVELLSRKKEKFSLSVNTPFHTIIEPFSAVIWKLTEKKGRISVKKN